MREITGNLQIKSNKYYALINLYDENNKRKVKWIALKLDATRKNKREAIEKLNAILDQYNNVSSEITVNSTSNLQFANDEAIRIASLPVYEFILEWCQMENQKNRWQPTTYSNYLKMVNNRIKTYFSMLNDYLVKDVDEEVLNDFYIWIMRDCKAATAQRHHALLHTAFNYAVKKDAIAYNPCDKADKPKGERASISYYNADEVKQLLEVAKDDQIYLTILIAAKCGLRRSEVLGLKWDAIDFVNDKIYIRHKIEEVYTDKGLIWQGSDQLKSSSSRRELPLLPSVKEALIKEKEAQAYRKKMFRDSYLSEYQDYVCVDYRGNIFRPNYITEHFKLIVKQHNLKPLTFHGLRHSCASIMLAEGVPMKVIQEVLGHSTFAITADTYSHVNFDNKISAGLLLEKATA